LESFVFWDSKRPITAKILQKLNISALAYEFNQRQNLKLFRQEYSESHIEQLSLFESSPQYGNE
jgi:hypothetical protein